MAKRRQRDEISELATHGKIRNRLLSAKTLRSELKAAAERVMRLSEPGTPERFLTLVAVSEETGLSSNAIVDAILDSKSAPLPSLPPQKGTR